MIKIRDYNAIPWNDLLYYDESSPTFLRVKTNLHKSKIGKQTGWMDKRGYWCVKYKNSDYFIHRVVAILHGIVLKDSEVIDHLDRDRSNNSISNLVVKPWFENNRNHSKRIDNKTNVVGVKYKQSDVDGNSYIAFCKIDGKDITKSFACRKYGKELAFELACNARKLMIDKLNLEGYNYSNTHGIGLSLYKKEAKENE